MNEKITGKEFEKALLFRAEKMTKDGILSLGRYGVQAVMMNNKASGKPEWQVIPSLPDLEGVIIGPGRQVIIEAKVCSQASYPIYHTDLKRPKQIDHMLIRASQGALCYMIVHFNPRTLKTIQDDAVTYAFLVHPAEHFWRLYSENIMKSVDRITAEAYGIRVPWNTWSTRSDKLSPDLSVLLPGDSFKLKP